MKVEYTPREASDWLSPIIVKELRQGMRGRVFLGSFLLLQVAMLFCASGALVAASVTSPEQFRFFSGLFWFIIGIPLLVIIPALGNGALRTELQANSLELVYLTRLTPWRIVAGKWAALFAQSLLFAFAALPYLVLRYFLGGVDLVSELFVLLSLLILCGLLTAVSVGFSAHTLWLVRGGQMFFFFFAFISAMNLLFNPFNPLRFPGSTGGIDQNPFVLAAIFVPLTLLLLFEIGTGKIAPPAESRSFNFRTLGFLFLLGALFLELIGTGSILPLALACPALLVIAVLSVSERPNWIKSIYAPYTRRGLAGRIAGRFLLYPGWPSAIFYVTIIWLLTCWLLIRRATTIDDALILSLLLVYAGILFPVALTRLIRPSTPQGFPWFIGIHICMFLIALLVYVADQAGVFAPVPLVSFLPTSLALLLMWDVVPLHDLTFYISITSATIIFSLILLLIRAFPLMSLVRKMEQPLIPSSIEAAQP